MKLTVLGSGSPEAYARRASSGHLLEVGGQRILFDCGGGVVDRLLQAGFKPSDIDIVFFSHLHSDHMMDYARLVHAAWDEGAKPLQVFGPEPIGEITNKLFGRDGVFAHDLIARTELQGSQEVWIARGGTLPRPWPAPDVTEITPGFVFNGGDWTLESCAVPHAQPFLTCMAFSVTSNGRKFVYSGDAGITADFEAFLSNADLLLHWCYRLSDQKKVSKFYEAVAPTPVEIARVAHRNAVGQLVLTHFRMHMDDTAKHEHALQSMREVFSGPSCVAEDLSTFSI